MSKSSINEAIIYTSPLVGEKRSKEMAELFGAQKNSARGGGCGWNLQRHRKNSASP